MKLDSGETALLTLDFQQGIFGFVAGADAVVPAAAKAVEFARKKKYHVIHVGLGFAEGHPEIPDGHARFGMIKANNLFIKGRPSLDYNCVVLKDACFDADAEVHRVLTEKIFPGQPTVLTVDAFIAGQEG